MKTLRETSGFYLTHIKPTGLVLDKEAVEAQALKVAIYYTAFGSLEHQMDADVSLDTLVTFEEWSTIQPLFELYVERENAIVLEASRVMGVEVYGRSVSEIKNDITQSEKELQKLAFFCEIETI